MVTEDSNDAFDSLFEFMAKLVDKDDEKVKLIDIKKNLNNYSLKSLKTLGSALMTPCMSLLMKRISGLRLFICMRVKLSLAIKISKLGENLSQMSNETSCLKEKLLEASVGESKAKMEASSLQLKLEERLKKFEKLLASFLDINV